MDGFILSRTRRICVGIELTVPMEHNIADWHQSKLKKYEDEIRIEAERNNWTFHSCVLEVGARGWIPPSLVSSLNKLGLPAVSKLSNRLSLLALKSSYILWLNRFNRDFSPWRLHLQRSSLMLPDAGVVPRTRVDGPPNLKLFSRDGVGPKQGRQAADKKKSTALGQAQVVTERRVLVDGKWLREGKRSDASDLRPSGRYCRTVVRFKRKVALRLNLPMPC